jgi:signal transduction histidine kinase/DNA-binding response OmpR family regulator
MVHLPWISAFYRAIRVTSQHLLMTLTLSILVVVLFALCVWLAYAWTSEKRKVAALRNDLEETVQKHRNDELQLSQRSQLDTIKDEFISTVSHELRTPLTSIRGALGLLSAGLMGTLDAKAHNLLRIAVTNTDRLIRLINDILDLERMESGRASLQLRRCSLTDLVLQAIDTMTAMADSNGVKLVFSPSATPPPPSVPPERLAADAALGLPADQRRKENRDIPQERRSGSPAGVERRKVSRDNLTGPVQLYFDGDSDRILQVLINLLSNAIKFSPVDSTVTIYLEASPDLLHLRVADQGRGIPEDKLETIFDRFQQVEATDARQKGGTGLGLAICRSIIQQHGGSIWARRNPVHGVSLYVDLPRINRSTEQIQNTAPALPPRSDGAVLVCDDDPGIRTVVAEHLRRQGYRVIEASSGEQTLTIASEQPLDAILLDLYMPGLSGWETLERLKNNAATATVPVVILSVLSPAERPTIISDAQGWVQKPFHENLLFSELGRVLRTADGPGHVLLVEDDHDLASIVIAGFQENNVRINHAATRQQAIEQCHLSRPDLIILDLTLPDGDGFSLVDWLRQQPELRTLPLVVYSGREVSEQERSMLRLGPTQFLTKAKVQPQEVEELVLTMVNRLRLPSTSKPESAPGKVP